MVGQDRPVATFRAMSGFHEKKGTVMHPFSIPAITFASAIVLLPTPAQAAWETVGGYVVVPNRVMPEACNRPHNENAALKRSENRALRLPSGFKGRIEVFGHGIDLSPSASLQGGGSVTFYAKKSGVTNNARGCGTIGSVVLDVSIPDGATGSRTIVIGSERIAVQLVRPAMGALLWASQTSAGGSRPPSSPPVSAPPGTPPPPPPPVYENPSNCTPPSCNPGGGMMAALSGASGSTGVSVNMGPVRLPAGMGSCLNDIGGQFLLNGPTLMLTLPRSRFTAEVRNCLALPLYLQARVNAAAVDIDHPGTSFERELDRAESYPAPTFARHSGISGPDMVATNRDFFRIGLLAAFLSEFAGERRFVFRPTSGAINELVLIVRTDPANGVGFISPIVSGPRLSSTLTVAFELQNAPAPAATIEWRLRALSGMTPAQCFRSEFGSLVLSTKIGQLPLTATEAAGCGTARFALDIGVQVPSVGGGAFSAPYGRTIEFVPGVSQATVNLRLQPKLR